MRRGEHEEEDGTVLYESSRSCIASLTPLSLSIPSHEREGRCAQLALRRPEELGRSARPERGDELQHERLLREAWTATATARALGRDDDEGWNVYGWGGGN